MNKNLNKKTDYKNWAKLKWDTRQLSNNKTIIKIGSPGRKF